MTLKEMKERLAFILTDKSSGICTPEERAVWAERRKEAEEHARQEKAENDALLAAWFEQSEFVNGSPLKRLQLTLEYFLMDTHGEWKLPDNVAREVARCLLPNIIAYFETEEGKKEFAEWQKKKEAERLAVEGKINTNKKDGA